MKNTFIYMIAFLMLGFAACNDDYNEDVAPPQSNEQEAAWQIDFKTYVGDDLASPVNLNEMEPEASVKVLKSTLEAKDGATVSVVKQISKTADFAEYIDLGDSSEVPSETKLSPPNYTLEHISMMTVAEIDEAVKTLFGKAPNANEFYIRAYALVTSGTETIRSFSQVVGPVTVTPTASLIEPAYYLIGDMNGWNPDELIRFSHSGNNVYEDPHFSVLVEVAANTYFKIAPQSAKEAHESGGDFWGGVLGTAVDGDASLEGAIVAEDAGAIKIEDSGYVKISLNMEEYTYKVEPMDVNPFLYVPGNHQGWTPATAPMLYTENMDMVYTGFVYLDGEYKFTSQPDWDHTNYGFGGDGILTTDGGADNMIAPAGFYYLKADLNLLTYTQTATVWGLIGDATPGGWDASTPMTYDRGSNTWTVTTDITSGAFKFRANDAWDLNLGGDVSRLTFNGNDISIEGGNYTFILKLSNSEEGYSCTIKKNK